MLLFIVVAFVVVGVMSTRRVTASLRGVDAASAAAATARALRLQMVATAAFVFVTFVVRSAFSTMYAVSNLLRDVDRKCFGVTSVCDSSCYNVYSHITQWMGYTPEFQTLITLASSPITLLVVLWGMTPKSTLQLMKSTELSVRLMKSGREGHA